MIKFKSCPRCQNGDIFLKSDQYGRFFQCQQCAHIVDLEEQTPSIERAQVGLEEPAAASREMAGV